MNLNTIKIEKQTTNDISQWRLLYEEELIGVFEFRFEKGRYWLNGCDLEEEYQRCEIGTYVITEAKKEFGQIYFCIADRIQLNNHYKEYDKRYLTPEGIRFKDSLLRKGIIKPDWIKNPCLL